MTPQLFDLPNNQERIHTEDQLKNQKLDFSAAFMAVQYLVSQMESFPESITDSTLDALLFLIESNRFNSQKQVLFLYSSAAMALIQMAKKPWLPITKRIIPQLQELLVSSHGKRQKAVAQALGKLPVKLACDLPTPVLAQNPLKISLDSILAYFGSDSDFKWQGRSLIVRADNGLGIIKFTKSSANIAELVNEISWMEFLQNTPPCPGIKFYIPCPIKIKGHQLFEILPSQDSSINIKQFHSKPIAIAYYAKAHYFDYPNENVLEKNISNGQIKEIFCRNAQLLGTLTSKGIIHTALIPLFHNRVQQGRRNDNGAYLWEHGGRLDQWLDSCQYPNFASSGLRDFEHLILKHDSQSLGHYIGEHILSFVLVIGSYFRNKAPSKRGKIKGLPPCDTRDLFDRTLFFEIVKGVVENYYIGITGDKPNLRLFLGLSELVDTLIQRMGMDENMEEVLRIQDQQTMKTSDFAQFLRERGIENSKLYPQGEKDIVLMTGPHLGGFSQPISIPSLIEFLFCLSSLCVSDRFLMENTLKTYVK